jgi:cyclopropane fatty-acyl-phospholipid synthase-like methyltransferase
METHEAAQIAAAMDATPELVPYLPDLLADLWDLGSSPPLVSEWLNELGLPADSTRVLDLGCGKGAVSLTLARDLGFHVHGVDLMEPFVQDARDRAEEWGIVDRCRFERGNIHDTVRSARGYDVVVYASVGALGPLDAAVSALRGCVRAGGYMVVDEGFRAPGAETAAGFENLVGYEESRRRLVAHGDAILHERLLSPEEMRAVDRRYIESIAARAEALAAQHPEDADLVRSYVVRQKQAAARWERAARSAAWLLGKAMAPR